MEVTPVALAALRRLRQIPAETDERRRRSPPPTVDRRQGSRTPVRRREMTRRSGPVRLRDHNVAYVYGGTEGGGGGLRQPEQMQFQQPRALRARPGQTLPVEQRPRSPLGEQRVAVTPADTPLNVVHRVQGPTPCIGCAMLARQQVPVWVWLDTHIIQVLATTRWDYCCVARAAMRQTGMVPVTDEIVITRTPGEQMVPARIPMLQHGGFPFMALRMCSEAVADERRAKLWSIGHLCTEVQQSINMATDERMMA